ncbi:MAG: glycosyltransferase family 4 protein [Paeniclostridium sordellii]|uniref:Glycosyltransferase family 4 protein n=1 Tax=Paeniclostridium hominis TaxID=2764329 RepID=A0ABR7K4N6_9FIRM|nr:MULTISPECIES: glycosyltransferase family 4 protein [Paeniclostridium]MBC6004076.1 glycosyltransferase family 4 protein [Paeniclostridium hominis]MDU2591743.1 glycosyltransferase family 4 protein [Paeniclostridium sordellii]
MKKNIMIINFGTHFGGTEKYIHDIIKNLDLEKYNLHICCRSNTDFHKSINKIDSKELSIVALNISKTNFFNSISFLKKYINKNNIDIIHSNGIFAELISSMAGKKIKKISTVHGFSDKDRMDRSFVERKLFRILEKILFNSSELYIAVSKSIEVYLINLGLQKEKIRVINHGIEIIKENNIETVNNKIVIGSVGRIEKVKGYKYLVKAVANIINSGYLVECIIVGDGEEKEEILKLSRELKIENYINLVGFKSNIYDYIKKMDIYVQPSLNESFGISILEAMNVYRPIIASNVGGIPEIINNNIDGLLFEAGDYDELSDKIAYLINNKERRLELGINGHKKLIDQFDIKKSIKKLEELYDSLG